MDKFFTQKHCDRCGKDLSKGRTMSMSVSYTHLDIFHFTKVKKIKFKPRAVGKQSDLIRVYSKTNKSKGESGNISVSGKFKKGIARPGNVLQIPGNQSSLKHSAAFPVKLPAFFIKLKMCIRDRTLGIGIKAKCR